MSGPSLAFAVLEDFQSAGAAHCVALHGDVEQPLGGGKAPQPASDATFNFARVFGWTTLEARVGFIQLRTEPLALAFEHGQLLFPTGAGTAQHVLFLGPAVGMGDQLDFHAGLDFAPVRLLEQLGLESLELALGRADNVMGTALRRKARFSSLTMPRSSTQMRLGLPYFFSINSTISWTVVTSAVLPAKTS
jgi:hypothetical protein